MNLRLLGTGAADGIPAFYGRDRVSRHAREAGGKDRRTRSAAVLDGVIKIDLGPDTYHQCVRDGIDPRDWTAILFTHSHEDHLAVSELQYALYPFTEQEQLPAAIYGNATVCRKIRDRYPDWPLELHETRSFVPFVHGAYTVTPVRAFHTEGEDCQNLLIERDGRAILYATDTGVWESETFEFLKGRPLHAIVLECTDALCPSTYDGHLDLAEMVEVVGRLRTGGSIIEGTEIVSTHHAASGLATHAELEAAFAPHGFAVGFDGMVLAV